MVNEGQLVYLSLRGGAEESESREIRSIRYSNIWHKARLLPTQHGKGAPIHKLSEGGGGIN